ncbi:hypothetical protein ANASTE_01586 [Anaerofustis stercorihominis DSM 17244]|uniref:Uncharacterized protein n=1 Tax=Anaerofustis stercorihominis DSM 17244 TaxID=445971 RepID=B1CC86_9FIRM|nr:hypothetical protein [Anaerofustis stercorihominis]EDS71883.1 hypothetical protein ANASTE_01586 [Anaerofustis stercorihominis DSM 17244]
MGNWIKEHKFKILLIIVLIILVIGLFISIIGLLVLPKFIYFTNSDITADYVGYYGMIITSVISTIVTVVIFYYTLTENRKQIEKERKFTEELAKEERKLSVKPYLSSSFKEIVFNKMDSRILSYNKEDEKYLQSDIKKIELEQNNYDHVVWLYDKEKVLEQKDYTGTFPVTETLSMAIRNKSDFFSLKNKNNFYIYTIKNVGANNAINIRLTINGINTLPPFHLSENEIKKVLFVSPKTNKFIDIRLLFENVLGTTYYEQKQLINLNEHKSINLALLSKPEEIKNE